MDLFFTFLKKMDFYFKVGSLAALLFCLSFGLAFYLSDILTNFCFDN